MNKYINNKIEEAEYFYLRMEETRGRIKEFKFNLSAFLSASRSVLQYAYTVVKAQEENGHHDGKKWYDEKMSDNSILKFFKDKRDFNIHIKPLTTPISINAYSSLPISTSASVSVGVKDKSNNMESQSICDFQPRKSAVENDLASIEYRFEDRLDDDVFSLCEEYIKEIKEVIEDGKSKGFLIID